MTNTAAIRMRLSYLCEHSYGGNAREFAKKLGVPLYRLRRFLNGACSINSGVLCRIAQSGAVNSEWLLCGTGPVAPKDRVLFPPSFSVSERIQSSCSVHVSHAVQYTTARQKTAAGAARTTGAALDLQIARAIHAARVAGQPVVLYANAAAIVDAGAVIVDLLRNGYVTAIAMSSRAALCDLEYAHFGAVAPDKLPHEMAELNRAAYLAAAQGLSYGEALGRWAFPNNERRAGSVIATAYELNLPAAVLVTLGDAVNHFYPAMHGAELGAALGAAGYTDLLIFTDQVRQLNQHGGVFIGIDSGDHARQLLDNATLAANSGGTYRPVDFTSVWTGEEPRRNLLALFHGCSAVYDGSADDVERTRDRRVDSN